MSLPFKIPVCYHSIIISVLQNMFVKELKIFDNHQKIKSVILSWILRDKRMYHYWVYIPNDEKQNLITDPID